MSLFDFDKPKRLPITAKVKNEVYARARGKCERCSTKMTKNQGNFHHTRTPSVRPTSKTVQFLCPNCHQWYGHKHKTRKSTSLFGTEKTRVTKRVKVAKAPTKARSSSKKKSPKKPKASKKTKKPTKERARTKSGRFRKKRSDAGKKRKN